MIQLYYAPHSCALSIHILLEFLGAWYEANMVQIGSEEFKKIAPKWAVPALLDPDFSPKALTQVVAIAQYLLQKFPSSLGSNGTLEENYEFIHALSFLHSDLHTTYGSAFGTKRFTTQTDEASYKAIQEACFIRLERQLGFLEDMLWETGYVALWRLTFADIYAYVIYRWTNMINPPLLQKFPNILKHLEMMEQHPLVQKVIAVHSQKK